VNSELALNWQDLRNFKSMLLLPFRYLLFIFIVLQKILRLGAKFFIKAFQAPSCLLIKDCASILNNDGRFSALFTELKMRGILALIAFAQKRTYCSQKLVYYLL